MSVEVLPPARAWLRVPGALIAGYGLAGAVAFAGECALDEALRAPGPLRWLAYAAGLGAASGALSGCALALALILLRTLRQRVRIALVCSASLGVGAYMLRELGVLARLSGRYSYLAWAAVGCIGLLCSGVALLALALSPRGLDSFSAARDNWLTRAARARRLALLAVLLLGAAVALIVDASLWVDEYTFFHDVLRKSARLACTVVVAQLLLPLSARGRVLTASTLAALTLAALISLSSDNAGALVFIRQAQLVRLALGELRTLGDLDADGFAPWLGGGDCAALDPNVHPGARELPGNGIDDNCQLGDLPRAHAATPAQALRTKPDAPSIVLITIDTLRADHMSFYGYPRATTPHIDAFFATGTGFADAVAPGAYTTISMPALMRGTYARHLSWQVALQTDRFRLLPPGQITQLEPGEQPMNAHLIAHDFEHPALAQRLRALGYHTLAVVDDGGSSFLDQAIMGEGFEEYQAVSDATTAWTDPDGDARVADHALAQLKAADAQPFFLWLHFYGVHAPSVQHAGVESFGDNVIDRYDHEIASLDQQLARVLAAISSMQQSRPLLTLLTADHGESFYSFGRAHGIALSDNELSVPLLVRGPGFTRKRSFYTVSTLDILPTLMTLVTENMPEGLDGVSLLQPTAATPRIVFADLWRYDARGRIETERVAAVSGADRVVWDLRDNTRASYARHSQAAHFRPPPALELALFQYLESAAAQPDALLD